MNSFKPTAKYSFIQGSFWMSFCIIFSFTSVFLLPKGYTNTQVGLVIALGGILSAILQPVIAAFADNSTVPLRKYIELISVLIILMAFVLLIPGLQYLLLGIFYGLMVAFLQILTPIINALGMQCINKGISLNFGVARGIGSVAYALISFVAGKLVVVYGEGLVPVLAILTYVLLFLFCLNFRYVDDNEMVIKEKKEENTEEKLSAVQFFQKYHHFLPLIIGVTCSFISHNILNNFLLQIISFHGGGSGQMGTAMALSATVELPTMIVFSYLVTKFSSGKLLKISGLFFAIKAFATLLAPNIFAVYCAQCIQFLGFALFVPASVYYVNSLMEEKDRIKGQAYMTVTNTVGSIFGSMIGGCILDIAGVKAALFASFLLAAAGTIIIYFMVDKKVK